MKQQWGRVIRMKKREGNILIYALLAMTLLVLFFTAAWKATYTSSRIGHNDIVMKQLYHISESGITYGLWKLEKEGKFIEDDYLVSFDDQQKFHVALVEEEARPGVFTVRVNAYCGKHGYEKQIKALLLDQKILMENEQPYIALLSEDLTLADLSRINEVGPLLVVGSHGGVISSFKHQGDVHLCLLGDGPHGFDISEAIDVNGVLILDGDVRVDAPLQAKKIYVSGSLHLGKNGMIKADEIWCKDMQMLDQDRSYAYQNIDKLEKRNRVYVLEV